jgi:hypothetical protein
MARALSGQRREDRAIVAFGYGRQDLLKALVRRQVSAGKQCRELGYRVAGAACFGHDYSR